MKKSLTIYSSAEILDENYRITTSELCEFGDITTDFIEQLIEFGLIEPIETHHKEAIFDALAFRRFQTALRLHRDLNINIEGIALALELLEELEQAREKIAVLERQIKG